MTRRWELLSAIAAAVCGNVFAQAQSADHRAAFTYVAQSLPLTDASKDVSVSVSGDGRFIAFESLAPLVPEDGNNLVDIYLLDRATSEVVLVSRSFDGTSANGNSAWPRMSADGRFVAFDSGATRLVRGDTNARQDVFLWNRATRTLERISVSREARRPTGGVVSRPSATPARRWCFSRARRISSMATTPTACSWTSMRIAGPTGTWLE